jgi:hypothetical protein
MMELLDAGQQSKTVFLRAVAYHCPVIFIVEWELGVRVMRMGLEGGVVTAFFEFDGAKQLQSGY